MNFWHIHIFCSIDVFAQVNFSKVLPLSHDWSHPEWGPDPSPHLPSPWLRRYIVRLTNLAQRAVLPPVSSIIYLVSKVSEVLNYVIR